MVEACNLVIVKARVGYRSCVQLVEDRAKSEEIILSPHHILKSSVGSVVVSRISATAKFCKAASLEPLGPSSSSFKLSQAFFRLVVSAFFVRCRPRHVGRLWSIGGEATRP